MSIDNGAPQADGLSSATPIEPASPSRPEASIPSAELRDAILLEVAGWIEEGDLIAFGGIAHKWKRVREDAALRVETSKEVRARMAAMIRGRMENKVSDPAVFLKGVADGRYDRMCTGYVLREAIALADKRLLTVEVLSQIAGPWNNVVDSLTRYRFTLTEDGEALLAQAMSASGQDPKGLEAKPASAVRQDAPEPSSHTSKGI